MTNAVVQMHGTTARNKEAMVNLVFFHQILEDEITDFNHGSDKYE